MRKKCRERQNGNSTSTLSLLENYGCYEDDRDLSCITGNYDIWSYPEQVSVLTVKLTLLADRLSLLQMGDQILALWQFSLRVLPFYLVPLSLLTPLSATSSPLTLLLSFVP